jgi:hypothetical protein
VPIPAIVPESDDSIEKRCGRQRRHADIDFKRFWPRQPAQALPDLRKTRLVLLYAKRGAYLDMYARERWGAKD